MNNFKSPKVMILASLTILMLGYQNCSKVKMDNASGGSEKSFSDGLGEIPDLEDGSNDLPGAPGQPGQPGNNPPRNNPPVAMQPVDQPSDEDVDYPGNNRFTAIDDDSFLLACGKQIHAITHIGKRAKVVLVNSNLSSVTNIEGELLLVNSQSARPTNGKENFKSVSDAAEIAMWEARCQAYDVEDINKNDADFAMTSVGIADVAYIPKSAPSYRFTAVGDVELVNLHTNFFKATSIHKGATIKIKTESFRMTAVTSGSVMELY